ncbi:MAG: hypothetical protein H6Q73_3272 [Firmicutes bacterium]|nr:hypothetical protein [Bacillota bacterium]
MRVGDTVRLAVNYSDKPVKALAREFRCSDDALYSAMKEIRPIPSQAREKLAKLNMVGMMAATLEATGFSKLFSYLRVDRHIYSLIHRVYKEDREADEALRKLPELLLDKGKPDDLKPEDRQIILSVGKEIIERIHCEFNLLAELERQYGISFQECLIEKEKAACAATQTTSYGR